MDHAVPPAPPVHHAGIPLRVTTPPFARGGAPGWMLTETADGIVLALDGVPAVQFGRGAWRATPRGRTLTATGPGGVIRLAVQQALCRDGTGRQAALIWNGRTMPGCLLDSGDRPYDGGR